ncbi:allophanate hydrolase-related protein [Vacuolonema iberomarrocanum]|uniref:allophanate hydrolase-related protein n=1 Tax=Vacuolonema iberomarrocanum TaxID=3454632 RepID=UPI0019DA94A2|nr:gamma-glutamylcyclotransferase [filamentous cyanobacterium LEGE 07170]
MSETRRVFICGSALRGQPDHHNLGEAKFIKETKTQPLYRLHSVQNGWHPGIYSVETNGISIPGEIYELSLAEFSYLAENEPPNMYPESILLDGDETAIAFLYPRELVEEHNWEDISQYGGWVAYKDAIKKS